MSGGLIFMLHANEKAAPIWQFVIEQKNEWIFQAKRWNGLLRGEVTKIVWQGIDMAKSF